MTVADREIAILAELAAEPVVCLPNKPSGDARVGLTINYFDQMFKYTNPKPGFSK